MEQLWTVRDVSEYLGVPVTALYRWRAHRYGPPARRVGKHHLTAVPCSWRATTRRS